jgi:hypothetical protein
VKTACYVTTNWLINGDFCFWRVYCRFSKVFIVFNGGFQNDPPVGTNSFNYLRAD